MPLPGRGALRYGGGMTVSSPRAGDDGALAALLAGRAPRHLRRRAHLYDQGDAADTAWVLRDGIVKLVATNDRGFQALIAFSGPGDVVGVHSAIDGVPRLATAIAITDAVATPVPIEELIDHLRRHTDVAIATMQDIAGDLRSTMLHVLDIAAGDAIGLVAKRLVQLADDDRFERFRTIDRGRIAIDMPISQAELASWAGISHRSAGDALQHLRDHGIVSTGRMRLEIDDLAGLREHAIRSHHV